MTPTERLRALLDECGVEYRTHGTTDRTWFEVGHISWFIHERENRNFTADAVFLTPEQAIAATLGSCNCTNDCTNSERTETCHNVWDIELTGRLRFQCSECGAVSLEITPNFCPVCGRRVVEPTTNDVDAEVGDGRP